LTEEEIVRILDRKSEEFRKLEEEHKNLEAMLSAYHTRLYLNADEEFEKKKLQKLKLNKKDRMAALIREFRLSQPAN